MTRGPDDNRTLGLWPFLESSKGFQRFLSLAQGFLKRVQWLLNMFQGFSQQFQGFRSHFGSRGSSRVGRRPPAIAAAVPLSTPIRTCPGIHGEIRRGDGRAISAKPLGTGTAVPIVGHVGPPGGKRNLLFWGTRTVSLSEANGQMEHQEPSRSRGTPSWRRLGKGRRVWRTLSSF